MCVYSAVMDQYRPWIQPIPQQWPQTSPVPQTWPVQPIQPAPVIINNIPFGVQEITDLIESLRKALEAAEKFDALTGQPDCVDPEKATLMERVEELEQKLEEIAKAASSASE